MFGSKTLAGPPTDPVTTPLSNSVIRSNSVILIAIFTQEKSLVSIFRVATYLIGQSDR